MNVCLNLLNPILKEYAADNAQFPLYFFEDVNCQGARYPPEGEFNLWYQYLGEPKVVPTSEGDVTVTVVTSATLGMSEIKSLYVPPQAVLEMWTPNDEGYFTLVGPQVVPDTSALLGAWRTWDDAPCNDSDTYCGKKLNWTLGNPIYRMRISTSSPWTTMLARLAANKKPLTLQSTSYPVNNDLLYSDICPGNGEDYGCDCQNAWDTLLLEHPGAAAASYVNILPNGCDATTQFVPSAAQAGLNTVYECQNQIQAQLRSGTFPTLSNGGPAQYVCAGTIYLNSYDHGSADALARFDDEEDDKLELQEMMSSTPSYAYWVLGAICVLAFLLMFAGMLHQGDRNRTHAMRKRVTESRLYPSVASL